MHSYNSVGRMERREHSVEDCEEVRERLVDSNDDLVASIQAVDTGI